MTSQSKQLKTCAAFVHDPYDIENPKKEVMIVPQYAAVECQTRLTADGEQSSCPTESDHDECASAVDSDTGSVSGANTTAPLQQLTIVRSDLTGFVPFVVYDPTVAMYSGMTLRCAAPHERLRPAALAQLFFGQLPTGTSDSVIVWLCRALAGAEVLYIERLMKRQQNYGAAAGNGSFTEDKCCMQVFVDACDAHAIITALHKKVLFDVSGVWVATNADECAILATHCEASHNATLVIPGTARLPSRTIVVEMATSTFVRGRRKQLPPPYTVAM